MFVLSVGIYLGGAGHIDRGVFFLPVGSPVVQMHLVRWMLWCARPVGWLACGADVFGLRGIYACLHVFGFMESV